ncbi:MAG: hypothetical protein M3436_17415 [Pseudomonadota bacterium]|nr:hypothetical protein [Pseudomonadota bacterium]
MSGGGTQLRLFPSKVAEAEARFQLYKREPSPADKGAEDPKKWAAVFLPAAAGEAQFTTRYKNPFMFGETGSTELIFAYTASGRLFNASIAIVDLSAQERLVVTTTARASDFQAVRREIIASLFRWTPEQ